MNLDFNEVWPKLEPMIRQQAKSFLSESAPNAYDTVADMAQEASIAIWQDLSTYDPQRGELEPWAVSVARNLWRKMANDERTYRAVLDEYADATSLGLVPSTPDLCDPDRQAVYDLWSDGVRIVDIAERLDIPVGTVGSRLDRAKKCARKCSKCSCSSK